MHAHLVVALALRWIAGDLHEHVTPADQDADVTFTPRMVAEQAARQKMEFVILTPHLWPKKWKTRRARFLADWAAMVEQAAAEKEITLIPGVEYSVPGLGHFGVSGIDLAGLKGEDFLAAARAAGAFVVVNHPYSLPTNIPGVSASRWDISYRPWSRGARGDARFDGVEVWNVPLSLANVVSRPGGKSGEARALESADRVARAEKRHIVLVGGSDNHQLAVMPTTWVLAEDASAPAVLAALRAGRTCVGGSQAGTLSARGDRDADWVGIGGSVAAETHVELRFEGEAEVFVDGVSQGLHDGGYLHEGAAGPHTYRIVAGTSRSGFIYANF